MQGYKTQNVYQEWPAPFPHFVDGKTSIICSYNDLLFVKRRKELLFFVLVSRCDVWWAVSEFPDSPMSQTAQAATKAATPEWHPAAVFRNGHGLRGVTSITHQAPCQAAPGYPAPLTPSASSICRSLSSLFISQTKKKKKKRHPSIFSCKLDRSHPAAPHFRPESHQFCACGHS